MRQQSGSTMERAETVVREIRREARDLIRGPACTIGTTSSRPAGLMRWKIAAPGPAVPGTASPMTSAHGSCNWPWASQSARPRSWPCAARTPMPADADICRKSVVPQLVGAGWDNDPNSIAEQRTITDGRIVPVGNGFVRKPPKRVDYLLRYTRDFSLPVVDGERGVAAAHFRASAEDITATWQAEGRQSARVDQIDRIAADVGVGVEAAGQANRVGLRVAAEGRIIVAEVVVEMPGLGLGAASEQAQELPFTAGQSHQPLGPDCARRICRRRPPRRGPVAPHLGARAVDLANKHAPECL